MTNDGKHCAKECAFHCNATSTFRLQSQMQIDWHRIHTTSHSSQKLIRHRHNNERTTHTKRRVNKCRVNARVHFRYSKSSTGQQPDNDGVERARTSRLRGQSFTHHHTSHHQMILQIHFNTDHARRTQTNTMTDTHIASPNVVVVVVIK